MKMIAARHCVGICACALAWRTAFLPAQTIAPPARASGTTISGSAYDSLGRAPLANAWVQLVAADSNASFTRTVVADLFGRYTINDVPDGRYWLAFQHPMLDSLPVELPPRTLIVSRSVPVHADLAIPSATTLRASICNTSATTRGATAPSGGVVIGVVRDAHDRTPVDRATVTGEWLELSFRQGGFDQRRPRVSVNTGSTGWFALCNAPTGGTMYVQAGRGADDTDLIEVQVPSDGFLRRDLYVGHPASVVAAKDTASGRDSANRTTVVRTGDERVQGTVVTLDGKRPLAHAQVRVIDGPSTRTNEIGEWAIANAPPGTRVLEVRAVGFYPERRTLDVITDATPVRVALSTFKAVLDTVRVRAARVGGAANTGFELRRRSGLGQYLTSEDLVRRGVFYTSDVFKNMRAVQMDADGHITIRSAFQGSGRCEPSVYIDGMNMYNMTGAEIDLAVRVKEVKGIEVYDESNVPPQFQLGLSGCGSILIWTR